MVKIYDKAKWHIEAGIDANEVINRFKNIFAFLENQKMLSNDGKEIVEIGIDSNVSLNEKMVNDNGRKFLDACYDKVIDNNAKTIQKALSNEYKNYIRGKKKL